MATFVLDDLHTIARREIHESLSFFVEHLTPSIHLVIATRKDPALPLARLAEGLTNKEIGDHLFISPYTVRAHTFNICGKLDVRNCTEAAARARELGILS